MARPENDENVKYVKLNKRNFEDRIFNNDSGLLICIDDVFHNAQYDLDNTVFLDDGTTTQISELYNDMVDGTVEVYAVLGEYPELDEEDKVRRVLSYDEIVDRIIEDSYVDDEY